MLWLAQYSLKKKARLTRQSPNICTYTFAETHSSRKICTHSASFLPPPPFHVRSNTIFSSREAHTPAPHAWSLHRPQAWLANQGRLGLVWLPQSLTAQPPQLILRRATGKRKKGETRNTRRRIMSAGPFLLFCCLRAMHTLQFRRDVVTSLRADVTLCQMRAAGKCV